MVRMLIAAWCLLLLAMLAVSPAQADSVALRTLVPEGAGLVVEADRLAEQAEAFSESDLFQRWKAYPPIAKWREENLPALNFLGRQVASRLGLEFEELRDQVLGGSAILAIYPRVSDGQWSGSGLVIIESRDAELLAKAVEGWDAAMRSQGELIESKTLTHNGKDYVSRVVKRGGQQSDEFLVVFGEVAAISDQEGTIRQVIDLHAARPKPAGSLAADAWYTAILAHSQAQTVIRVAVHPQRWIPVIEAWAAGQDPENAETAPFVKGLVKVCHASQGMLGELRFESGVAIDMVWKFDRSQFPLLVDAALKTVGGPNEYLSRTPKNALLAIAGRCELGFFTEQVWKLVPEAERRDLDKLRGVAVALFGDFNLLDGVFGKLGPEFCLYLAPTDRLSPHRPPVEAVAGLQLRDHRPAEDQLSLREQIELNLQGLFTVAAIAQNAENPEQLARVHTRKHGEVRVTWIDGLRDWPADLHPCFAVLPTALVVATTPEVLRQAVQIGPSDSLAGSSLLTPWLRKDAPQPSFICYLNVAASRELLAAHRDRLITDLAAAKQVEPEKIAARLKQLADLLALSDVILCTQSNDAEGLWMSFRMGTSGK